MAKAGIWTGRPGRGVCGGWRLKSPRYVCGRLLNRRIKRAGDRGTEPVCRVLKCLWRRSAGLRQAICHEIPLRYVGLCRMPSRFRRLRRGCHRRLVHGGSAWRRRHLRPRYPCSITTAVGGDLRCMSAIDWSRHSARLVVAVMVHGLILPGCRWRDGWPYATGRRHCRFGGCIRGSHRLRRRLDPPDMRAFAAPHLAPRRSNRLNQIVTRVTGWTDDDHGCAVSTAVMRKPSGIPLQEPAKTTI